jgi:hypothetical protein
MARLPGCRTDLGRIHKEGKEMSSRARVKKPSADNIDFHYKALLILLFTFVLNLTSVAPAQAVPFPPSLSFVPVTPCRIADTRNAAGPFGGPALAANGTRSFVIPSSACNIPTTALAYALNFTVVPQHVLSYLTVWPTGVSQPLVSTLNSPDGRIKANAAIMPAGSGGAISVYATDETQVIIDISGYFVASTSSSALAFFPLPPCRVADTRNADAPLGGPYLTGGQERDFPVLASSCGVPSYAQAYSLNFTVVPHVPLGFLTVWPSGESQPLVSTLNALTGTVTANAAIVPAGSGGDISAYVTNSADLVIDINGYFAPASNASQPLWLETLAPCRVLDTRTTGATLPLTLPVAGTCSVPSSAEAFVLNATVVPEGPLYFLTLWPAGETEPLVSTLNAMDGVVTSNMAIVPTSNGSIEAASSGKTNLVLDINGYFAPAAAPPSDTLTVSIPGNTTSSGVGFVSSSPGGIYCGWMVSGDQGTHGIQCSFAFSPGTVVTLTATPMSGYVLGSWSGGGCSGTASTCTVTMNAPVTVTANFTKPTSQTITLTPTYLNWLEASNLDTTLANKSFPGQSEIAVGQDLYYSLLGCNNYLNYGSLVWFNLSGLAGKTIDSATLTMNGGSVLSVPGNSDVENFQIAVVATSWSPTTVTANATTSMKFYTSAWPTGMWLTEAYPTYHGQPYSIDMTSIVKNWESGYFANDGLIFESIYYWSCAATPGELDVFTLSSPKLSVTYH